MALWSLVTAGLAQDRSGHVTLEPRAPTVANASSSSSSTPSAISESAAAATAGSIRGGAGPGQRQYGAKVKAADQWPVKHSAVVEGELVLGGLMMVHEREDSVVCGPVMPQGGIQALEAMLYTLDWLNQRDTVPGVKIGAHILDDCDKDTYGLEMAVDFIKGELPTAFSTFCLSLCRCLSVKFARLLITRGTR